MRENVFLLADDDQDDQEMFFEALTSINESIVCHAVLNGREALEKLNELEKSPDLIFLDVNMPVMTGWECLEKLKKEERYKNIPVVIISTSSYLREKKIALEMGALCYLTKPNDFDELKDVLRIIVESPGDELPKTLQRMQANGSTHIYARVEEEE